MHASQIIWFCKILQFTPWILYLDNLHAKISYPLLQVALVVLLIFSKNCTLCCVYLVFSKVQCKEGVILLNINHSVICPLRSPETMLIPECAIPLLIFPHRPEKITKCHLVFVNGPSLCLPCRMSSMIASYALGESYICFASLHL